MAKKDDIDTKEKDIEIIDCIPYLETILARKGEQLYMKKENKDNEKKIVYNYDSRWPKFIQRKILKRRY